jgi:dCTP deaminase
MLASIMIAVDAELSVFALQRSLMLQCGIKAMVLSDRTIKEEIAKGRIVIEPLTPNCIQPASVDLHLDKRLLVFKMQRYPSYIDVRCNLDHLTELVEIDEDNAFFLDPGEFVLASTLESLTLPDDIVGRLEGKSSLGRLGLLLHSTAGYVDPGWQGNLTIELSNVAKLPITLYYKMKIGQLSFLRLTSPVDRLYGSAGLGSKYQGQTEPTASRYYESLAGGP